LGKIHEFGVKRKTVKSLEQGSRKSKQEVENARDAPRVPDPRVRSQHYQRQVNNFLRRQYQNKQSLRQKFGATVRDFRSRPVNMADRDDSLQRSTILAST